MANVYYDNLMKFDNIEIIEKLKNKLEDLSKVFSQKLDINGSKEFVSEEDVFGRLSSFYFYRDGAKVLKEINREFGKQQPKDLSKAYGDTRSDKYNKSFSDYLKKPIKVNEDEYNALFDSDPYVMKDVEKILGSYNSMKDGSTILVSCINLEIDEKYVDITYQINQEIGTVSGIKLEGVDSKGKEKTYKIDQDTLFVDKMNYNNTFDLSSLDGTIYYGIKIEDIINISHNIDKDKLINLNESITNINVNDLKNNDIDKIMVLENTIEEEKEQKNNEINVIS